MLFIKMYALNKKVDKYLDKNISTTIINRNNSRK